jgi:hypothetical protein
MTKVIKCYDNGGASFDRYTAVYPKENGVWTFLAMSDDPTHPQGFGQHGELLQAPSTYLGKRISFNSLPIKCQEAINRDLEEISA